MDIKIDLTHEEIMKKYSFRYYFENENNANFDWTRSTASNHRSSERCNLQGKRM